MRGILGARRGYFPGGGGGGGGLTILQVGSWESAGAPSLTRTMSPGSALTAGSAFVILSRHEMTVSGWSDGTNTYAHPTHNAAGGQTLDAYVASNVAGGTPTISITVDDFNRSIGGVYFEIGGANTTTATEANADDNASSTTSDWYGGSVTAAGSAVVIAWWMTFNDSLTDPPFGWTADATWSKQNYQNFWIDSGATYKIVTAGTYVPHVTPKTGYAPHLGSSIAIH